MPAQHSSSFNMLKKAPYEIMIRLFSVFGKLNFKTLSIKQIFLAAMEDFSAGTLLCPNCGAKHPIWTYHDSYERYLISYENGSIITNIIDITRIICSSCNSTHAVLPEIIIPYSSYSLLFVLSVLKDYFMPNTTISSLCEKYDISVSTLYKWKRLFLLHKQLWLGIIENIYQDALEFLSSIPEINSSKAFHDFFSRNNFSFLQRGSKTACFNSG